MGIKERYEKVREEVAQCCREAGRDVSEVSLIAVSKTVGIEGVRCAYEAGARDFGENRPDQIVAKHLEFPQAQWHFIGNIQSRRIPDIVSAAVLIHSLFKLDHARKIDKAAAVFGKVQDVLVEVNVSGEESKSGIDPDEVCDFALSCGDFEHVRLCGLMTMAPQGDLACAKECFEKLASLKCDVCAKLGADRGRNFNELSMGMSEDWRQAIYAGATMVRIGRAIFSEAFEG